MTQINFENSYGIVAAKILAYQRDFPKLTTAKRAQQMIDNDAEMNKIFNDKLLTEGLEPHIDLFA